MEKKIKKNFWKISKFIYALIFLLLTFGIILFFSIEKDYFYAKAGTSTNSDIVKFEKYHGEKIYISGYEYEFIFSE